MNAALFTPLFAVLLSILASTAHAQEKITLFAAASLTNALDEISALYTQQSGHPVRTSYAASSALARQIAGGAPADIYISANQRWMDYLATQGMLDNDNRATLLQNSLVLITQPHSTSQLDDFKALPALLATDRLAVGDPDHVPAGLYARQALESLGLWPQLAPRLARSHNVRAALLLVERGEAPLGIVYRSDALLSDRVRILKAIPPDSHQAIEYPIAQISGRQSDAVAGFYQFLRSPTAAQIFIQHGFSIAP